MSTVLNGENKMLVIVYLLYAVAVVLGAFFLALTIAGAIFMLLFMGMLLYVLLRLDYVYPYLRQYRQY